MKKKQVRFKETVGIDIGSHSIKIVHLKKLHEGFKLLNYEISPTVPTGTSGVIIQASSRLKQSFYLMKNWNQLCFLKLKNIYLSAEQI